MNKWLMILNSEKIEFDNFENATSSFIKEIHKYFWKHTYANKESTDVKVFDSECCPDELGSFFYYLYSEAKITDDEIVLDSRLRMLLSSFINKNPKDIKNNALKVISRPYYYHYEDDEIGYFIDIKIDYSKDEIILESSADEDSYLQTNAFIMDDENRKYYFDSHQICNTSNKGSDLGKTADLSISLEKND